MTKKTPTTQETPRVVDTRRFRVRDPETGFEKKIQVTRVQLPTGITDSLYVDVDKDSCQVLAVTQDQEVLLVRQWRPNVERVVTELPGGGLEEGEDPAEGARRELLEETGHECESLQFLMNPRYSPYSTGRRWSYIALGCRRVSRLDLDPNESLAVARVPVSEVLEEVRKHPGTIRGEDLILHWWLSQTDRSPS